uniref:Uncharacterized protein n=1 Tax=Oryza sativa subsp. japonica TaxID=39947 RepID=Q6YUM2_ORYSJ|nr:hypothetical protein [Oryza sativa Japonica Group]
MPFPGTPLGSVWLGEPWGTAMKPGYRSGRTPVAQAWGNGVGVGLVSVEVVSTAPLAHRYGEALRQPETETEAEEEEQPELQPP